MLNKAEKPSNCREQIKFPVFTVITLTVFTMFPGWKSVFDADRSDLWSAWVIDTGSISTLNYWYIGNNRDACDVKMKTTHWSIPSEPVTVIHNNYIMWNICGCVFLLSNDVLAIYEIEHYNMPYQGLMPLDHSQVENWLCNCYVMRI